jgi:upstream-binding transcription factor
MVSDARVWLRAPWQTYNNAKKIKHPDLPKKPLTPFFRYFMEKREKTGKQNPGSSVTDLAKLLSSKFASLNERKKQKYKDAYDREYEEYKAKLEQFKTDHPEVEFGTMNKQQSAHGHAQEGPPRPRTPQQLFMEEKMKKVSPKTEGKKESIERIKGLWAQLSEGKRIKWIRKALQDEQRYEAEVLEYIKEHPSFEPNKLKSVLTKAEKELKDKFDGKPERPPNSGYSLFSKILLRELKNVPSKEKMVVIAKRWKELSEADRNGYSREAQKAMTKYVEKFEAYLNQLPEAEREKVLSENKLKLPSEKKLKQQQSLPKLQIPLQSEHVVEEDPGAKEHAALMCYQMERCAALQTKYPNKGKSDIIKMAIQEWTEKLTDKKKSKYYKQSDAFASFMPSTSKTQQTSTLSPNKSNSKDKKPLIASTSFLKREPKRPPKSGYALYTSEQLSSLTNFEPKKRMTEIARKWNHEISKTEKENFDTKAKELAIHYQKDLANFMGVSICL